MSSFNFAGLLSELGTLVSKYEPEVNAVVSLVSPLVSAAVPAAAPVVAEADSALQTTETIANVASSVLNPNQQAG